MLGPAYGVQQTIPFIVVSEEAPKAPPCFLSSFFWGGTTAVPCPENRVLSKVDISHFWQTGFSKMDMCLGYFLESRVFQMDATCFGQGLTWYLKSKKWSREKGLLFHYS